MLADVAIYDVLSHKIAQLIAQHNLIVGMEGTGYTLVSADGHGRLFVRYTDQLDVTLSRIEEWLRGDHVA